MHNFAPGQGIEEFLPMYPRSVLEDPGNFIPPADRLLALAPLSGICSLSRGIPIFDSGIE
eukprot:scaffold208877_cov26-Tisochrysis_lutea.AAC.2